jgi:RNA polymerase sigma-70 factor, ECF subfamily
VGVDLVLKRFARSSVVYAILAHGGQVTEVGARWEFEALYLEVYPLVVRTVYLVVFDRDVAQEITHESFLRLWQQRNRLRDAEHPRAWLMRVAVNLAIDHRRSWVAGLRHRLLPTPSPDPAVLALNRLEIEDMRRQLLRLKPRDRAVLALRYEQGLTFPEIGRILGRPEPTVKTLLHRALGRLRRDIGGGIPDGTAPVEEAL